MNVRRYPVRFFLGVAAILALPLAGWLIFGREWHPLVAWLVTLNVVALPLWGYDKWASPREWPRVPEKALHLIAFLGAVPSSFLAMKLLRHKTLKPRFRNLYLAFLVLHAAILALWLEPGLRLW